MWKQNLSIFAVMNLQEGYAKWSLRLLADKMVELNYVESISHVTVRSVLKKTNLSLGG